jgi:DNA recombination protein RmuC
MDLMMTIALAVSLLSLLLLVVLLLRGPSGLSSHLQSVDSRLENCERGVLESAVHARDAKQATAQLIASFGQFEGRLAGIAQALQQIAVASSKLQSTVPLEIEQGLAKLKASVSTDQAALRQELQERDDRVGRMLSLKLAEIVTRTSESAKTLNETAHLSITTVTDRLIELKTTVDQALKAELGALRAENSAALETMRATVDEKLHATLEQRLGESFKLVSERLEQVHRGLGEMQSLATGVGDLRKVLTNVKTRGTWGEVQLASLLDQILTPEQYEKNVATRPECGARVEFAIKFPGRSQDGCLWLPIDAKFPLEDYQRLVDAQERVDVAVIEETGKALEVRIRAEAKSIREKYVEPPYTTDFAVMYLPTEGLYAEVLRRPGLVDTLQRDHKIVLCGPTTLAAMLNSLQMGFRTLAIEKRSSEVWAVLGTVKAEFGKFGKALEHTRKKLEEASSSIESAERRNRVLKKKLDVVDEVVAEPAVLVEAVEGRLLPGVDDEAA